MGLRQVSRLQRYQNAILDHYWPDAEVESERKDTTNFVTPYKWYKRPQVLYHYTSEKSAIEILTSGDPCGFALTHYRYLNDNKEFKLGLKLAMNWLKKRGTGLFPKMIVDKIEHAIKSRVADQSRAPYVLSFTTESDSTPQWMAYTDRHQGGYAIGLNFGKVGRAIDSISKGQMQDLHYERVLFAPCIYCSREDEENVKSFADVLDVAISGCASAIDTEQYDGFVKWCAGRLFQFAALVKGDAFRFEHEWRIVIRPQDADYISQIKFMGGKPRLRPSILPLVESVKSIVISPHGDYEKLRLTAELLGLKLGKRVAVSKSDSSYVGG